MSAYKGKRLALKKRILVPDHVIQAERDRFKEEFEMRTIPLGWQLFVEWYIRVLDAAMKEEGEESKAFMLQSEDCERKMSDCLDLAHTWVQLSEAWMERKREEQGGITNPEEKKIVTAEE